MSTIPKRWSMWAERAVIVATEHGYDSEYDSDDSLLRVLVSVEDVDDISAEDKSNVCRYLVIATENAGDGPADCSEFHWTKESAVKMMGDHAREGWVSRLWDLDSESTSPIRERAPR